MNEIQDKMHATVSSLEYTSNSYLNETSSPVFSFISVYTCSTLFTNTNLLVEEKFSIIKEFYSLSTGKIS